MKILVPATSANVGSGFDICGVALEKPFDEMQVEIAPTSSIKNIGTHTIPEIMEQNTAWPVIEKMREDHHISEGLEITVKKGIKPASGLGSSAATAAGAAYAINELFSLHLSRDKLVEYAALAEKISAGTPHVDNVAPAIYGGFTTVIKKNPLKIKKINAPKDLEFIIILPEKGKASTAFARSILPDTIPRASAHYNLEHLSALICSFLYQDVNSIIHSLGDEIIEPARAKAGILPHYFELKKLAGDYSYAAVASGSGPAMAVVGSKNNENKQKILLEIKKIFGQEKHGIIETSISNQGARAI